MYIVLSFWKDKMFVIVADCERKGGKQCIYLFEYLFHFFPSAVTVVVIVILVVVVFVMVVFHNMNIILLLN